MNVQFIESVGNVWPADAFYEHVKEATRMVLEHERSAVADEVVQLILREWLAFSWPAGRA